MTRDDCTVGSSHRICGVGTLAVFLVGVIPGVMASREDSFLPSTAPSIAFSIGFILSVTGLVLITCSTMRRSDLHTQELPAPLTAATEEAVSAEEPEVLSAPDWVGIEFDSSFDWELLEAVGDESSGRVALADIKKQYYTRLDLRWFQGHSNAEYAFSEQLAQLKSETDYQTSETGTADINGHHAELLDGSHAYNPKEKRLLVLNRTVLFDCAKSGRSYYGFIAASAYVPDIAKDLLERATHSFSCHSE